MPEITSYSEFFEHFGFSDSGYGSGNSSGTSDSLIDAPEVDEESPDTHRHRQPTTGNFWNRLAMYISECCKSLTMLNVFTSTYWSFCGQ
jgi:hypothetical protein